MPRAKTMEEMDREADAFARELLMPVDLFTASAKALKAKGPLTEFSVEALSREYQVSEVQVFWRLLELKIIKEKP